MTAKPPHTTSPTLLAPDAPARPAYEIKFVLAPAQAEAVERALLHALLPDPHADPALGGMYAITSLALDAPGLPVFFRDPHAGDAKHRVRRYGDAPQVYLERKRSRAGRVEKFRSCADAADLNAVVADDSPGATHAWFARAVRTLDLAPVCRVRYLRRALFGAAPEGPVRVTLDRAVRAALASAWDLDAPAEERAVLPGLVVCEFKFFDAMPALLKSVVTDLALAPTGFSKYRAAVRAFAAELGVPADRAAAPAPYACAAPRPSGTEHHA